MPYTLSPTPWHQFIDANGVPLAGGKLFTYDAGTTNPATVYRDVNGTPHTNPIILDAFGQCTIYFFIDIKQYKFVLTDANDVPVRTQDNIALPPGTGEGGPAPNINADLLDGLNSTDFVLMAQPVNAAVIPNLNADKLDSIDSSGFLKVPIGGSGVVASLNADLVDGKHYADITGYVDAAINALRIELKAYTDTKVAGAVPRVTGIPLGGSITPNMDTTDLLISDGINQTTTYQNPIGTLTDTRLLLIRVRDNGTARTLAWGTAYMTAAYVALPTATVAFRTIHMAFRYNVLYAKWMMVALTQEP